MESVHGHNVLNLVKEQESALTRESLMSAIAEAFGTDARYHTCSARDLTADELVRNFVEKGKLVEEEGKIQYQGCNCHYH